MGQGKCVPCHGEGKHDCFGMEKAEGANVSPSSGSKINIIHSPQSLNFVQPSPQALKLGGI